MSTIPVERVAYSPAEAAKVLGCTRQHVSNMVAAGKLPARRLGRRLFIPRDVVDRFFDELEGDTDG